VRLELVTAKIQFKGADVDDFRKAVKFEFEHKLSNIDAPDLVVSLTANGEALEADAAVPTGTTAKKPLFVSVPAPAGKPPPELPVAVC
jgi:hypothetical protein